MGLKEFHYTKNNSLLNFIDRIDNNFCRFIDLKIFIDLVFKNNKYSKCRYFKLTYTYIPLFSINSSNVKCNVRIIRSIITIHSLVLYDMFEFQQVLCCPFRNFNKTFIFASVNA